MSVLKKTSYEPSGCESRNFATFFRGMEGKFRFYGK